MDSERLWLYLLTTKEILNLPKNLSFQSKKVVQPIHKKSVNQKATNLVSKKCFAGEGVAVNSGFLDGMKTKMAQRKIIDYLKTIKLAKVALIINYVTGVFLVSVTGVLLFP